MDREKATAVFLLLLYQLSYSTEVKAGLEPAAHGEVSAIYATTHLTRQAPGNKLERRGLLKWK